MLAVSRSNPYLQSHPLTRDRITFVENHLAGRSDAPLPAGWGLAHARMVAKLRAFLTDPHEVLETYQDDPSVVGRYARAIAHYRLPDLPQALADIDGLLAEHPDDPYFHELKGQMLFENGRIADAIGPYREAVRLAPGAPLIRVGLAQALIESGAPAANSEAIAELEEVTRTEPDNAGAWRLLGVARGRDGLHGKSDVAFRRIRAARRQARRRAPLCQTRGGQDPAGRPRVAAVAGHPARDRGELKPAQSWRPAQTVSAASAHNRASVTLSTQPSTRTTRLCAKSARSWRARPARRRARSEHEGSQSRPRRSAPSRAASRSRSASPGRLAR